MIQAGQIGVGIIGKEGMQAVNVSDFAIVQFRFLRSLLLVHGRACYRRIALFMYYTFYKGTIYSTVLWLFSQQAMSSAGLIYLNIFNMSYYFSFSLFPVLVVCIFDFDVPKDVVGYMPELYSNGIFRINFTLKGFWLWTFEAIFAALGCANVPTVGRLGMLGGIDATAGRPAGDYFLLSWTSMFITTLGINFRLLWEIHAWNWLSAGIWLFTVTAFALIAVMFSYWYFPQFFSSYLWIEFFGFMPATFATSQFWFCTALGVVLYCMPRSLGKAWVLLFRPLSAAKKARRKLRTEGSTSKTRGAKQAKRMLTKSHLSDKVLRRASRIMKATAPTAAQRDECLQRQESRSSADPHESAGTGDSGFAFSQNEATSMMMFERSVSSLNKHASVAYTNDDTSRGSGLGRIRETDSKAFTESASRTPSEASKASSAAATTNPVEAVANAASSLGRALSNLLSPRSSAELTAGQASTASADSVTLASASAGGSQASVDDKI